MVISLDLRILQDLFKVRSKGACSGECKKNILDQPTRNKIISYFDNDDTYNEFSKTKAQNNPTFHHGIIIM